MAVCRSFRGGSEEAFDKDAVFPLPAELAMTTLNSNLFEAGGAMDGLAGNG